MTFFQTDKTNSLTTRPLFFSFFLNILSYGILSHLNFIPLSIVHWDENRSALCMVFLPHLSYRRFFHLFRFPASFIFIFMQRTTRVLRFYESSECSSLITFQKGFRSLYWAYISENGQLCRTYLSVNRFFSGSDSYLRTSEIEFYVTENNPKTLNAFFKKLKAYYKDIPDIDPYQRTYDLIPSQTVSCRTRNRCISTDISVMPINFPFPLTSLEL